MITVQIDSSVAQKDWLKVATRKAHKAAEQAGVSFVDAHIFIALPERGRCFVKPVGHSSLIAHG